MSEPEQAGQRVSVDEAATALGVSKETVRRMVREGRLDAERVETNRHTPMYRVALPAGGTLPTRAASPAQVIESPAAAVDTTAAMLSAFSRAVAPLMTPLVAQLVEQAETIGRLRAEVSHRRAPRRSPTRQRRAAVQARAGQA